FHYTVNVLANTFVPSTILQLTNTYVRIVNANATLYVGPANSSASPAISTYLTFPANGVVDINGSQVQTKANTSLTSVAKASLPAANSSVLGQMFYVADDVGGPCVAVCNGSAWCKLTLGAAVS